MTRGVKQQRDLFVKFMETQMLAWKRTNLKTGKDELVQVQGALRPVELWEYVFPEECLDEVLTMLDIDENTGVGWGISRAKLNVIRKALGKGIKKIPKYEKKLTNPYRYVEKKGMAIYPIGIKKDRRQKVEEWGYDQEML